MDDRAWRAEGGEGTVRRRFERKLYCFRDGAFGVQVQGGGSARFLVGLQRGFGLAQVLSLDCEVEVSDGEQPPSLRFFIVVARRHRRRAVVFGATPL